MKFSYGHKIAGVYILFMGFILTFVVISFTLEFDLEHENYYEKEINFGDEIKALNNFKQLGQKIAILQSDSLEIKFIDSLKVIPNQEFKLLFKRPSDKRLDWEINKQLKDGQFKIPWDSLVSGVYNLEIKFSNNQDDYLYKQNLFLNPFRK